MSGDDMRKSTIPGVVPCPETGLLGGYSTGCRCDTCRNNNRVSVAAARARVGSKTHLLKRVETLARVGATKWLKANRPDVWAEIRSEARQRAESEVTT